MPLQSVAADEPGRIEIDPALEPGLRDLDGFSHLKVSWITIPESTPAFEVYYDMKALWPVASLERLNSILASPEG
jgi:tRNA (Thr-GGU) A37 N-methylase